METLEAIRGRRSIRSYTDQPVSDELMEQMLRAAMNAPSAGNQQPWHFVVIDDRDVLDTIREFHPYAEMLKQAPVAIAVCSETRGLMCEEHWGQDCSAAVENLLLAAHALGLGAVWLGVTPIQDRMDAAAGLFGLPEGIVCFALVAIGHSAEQKAPNDNYDPKRVHRNRW